MAMQMDLLGLMAPTLRLEPIERIEVDHTSRDGWATYKAAEAEALARSTVELIKWGKGNDRGGGSGPFYALTLWHGDRGWRYKASYAYGNGGGGGPYGYAVYETRAAAMLAAFRQKFKSLAAHVAGCWADSDATRRQAEDLARWMIGQCPPLHFGGVNLFDEWEATKALAARREHFRCAALRAAHDLTKQLNELALELRLYAYSGGSDAGQLHDPDNREAPGKADPVAHARAWPAHWSIGGHAPDRFELHTYPSDGQAASPATQAFLAAVRAKLHHLPIVEHGEGWSYPMERYTWEGENDQ